MFGFVELDNKDGGAVAQAISQRVLISKARVGAQARLRGFFVDKGHWGRLSPSTAVTPANSHSTDCSILITYHPVLLQ
jgi:hypothetical protein